MGKFIWQGKETICKDCGKDAVGKQMVDYVCGEHWDYKLNAGIMTNTFAPDFRQHHKEKGTKLPADHMVLFKEYIRLNDELMKCGECDKEATAISDGGYRCDSHSKEANISGEGIEMYGHEITICKTGEDGSELEVTLEAPKFEEEVILVD